MEGAASVGCPPSFIAGISPSGGQAVFISIRSSPRFPIQCFGICRSCILTLFNAAKKRLTCILLLPTRYGKEASLSQTASFTNLANVSYSAQNAIRSRTYNARYTAQSIPP